MRLKRLFLFAFLAILAVTLWSCSRESSIKENVNLRNNHSVVFVSRTPFLNAEAFADSIINLPNPDSVLVSDTITVTVNDTIYMMGFLRHNADKIYLYQWVLDSLVKDDKGKTSLKKALVSSFNATPQSWVYQKEGVYSPLFVAIDGNNATDTAGADQYIRVINTSPYVGIKKDGLHHDTLWAKAKTNITFPILAIDSFGSLTSFKIDLDGNGPIEPKEWKYQKSESSDSLFITIPYDSTKTDSLGNQKIYIIITDDDGNETKDSLYLHFNQPPTLTVIGPKDMDRFNEQTYTEDPTLSLMLSYEGHDKDNEENLRYFVRIAATPDNHNDDIELSNVYDLVLKNSTDLNFSIIENGVNKLRDMGFTGNYFSWDVWVTDGFDTVVVEKCKPKMDGCNVESGKRPRIFYVGNDTTSYQGTAKFEGLKSHRGILVTFQNLENPNNIYTAETDADGKFEEIGIPAGTYTITATDETGRGFKTATLSNQIINLGERYTYPKILELKDPEPPVIYSISGIEDVISIREIDISARFRDIGSQVAKASATMDDKECSKTGSCVVSNVQPYKIDLKLTDLVDGEHSIKITATDSAGYSTDTTFTFTVHATNIKLSVNGSSAAMVETSANLVFIAEVFDANPPITELTLELALNDNQVKKVKANVNEQKKATFTLGYSDFTNLPKGPVFSAKAVSNQGEASNIVRYGFYGTAPSIIIESPTTDTTISIKDVITLKVSARDHGGGNNYTLNWLCKEPGKTATACSPTAAGENQFTYSWNTDGAKEIIASIKDNSNQETMEDTLRINVEKDEPTITINEFETTISKKINSTHKFEFTARDKFGTINAIAIKCDGYADYESLTITPAKTITDSLTARMASNTNSKYKCIVRATDDDNLNAYDTLFFNIIKDTPTIKFNIHSKNVTIKDVETIEYIARNQLNGPISIDLDCASNKANINLASGLWHSDVNGARTTVTMPSNAGKYYCIIRASDAENPTDYTQDTVTYSVFRAPPTVEIPSSYTKTIKDVVVLYASASDSSKMTLPNQEIVSYEWGCGPKSNKNILSSLTKTNSNTYSVTLPETAQNNYLCIVRVTDDDGLTALDTTVFTVELGMPSISIDNVSRVEKQMNPAVKIRAGQDIYLYAEAHDQYEEEGSSINYIAKKEWSCGANLSAINNNWKTVSTYDTTWQAPAASNAFYCVARATDDDGNMVSDTITLSYSTELPVISVAETNISIVEDDVFLLNASVNDVWQGINWFSWQCFYTATKQPAEELKKYDYYKNNKSFYDYRETLSSEGKDLYCVVSAEEKSSKEVFRDTTHVRILTQTNLAKGKITAADTIYPWSGDEAQSGYSIYYYTPEWGGYNSEIGLLGNENKKDYYWQFTNVGGGYFRGEKPTVTRQTGAIDTSMAQFNDAFVRPSQEGQFSICLDFRDSISDSPTQSFMRRHQADAVCRTIYVRRAWKNIATDTVLDLSTVRTPPSITTLNNKLTVAYLKTKNSILTKTYNGSSWTNLSTSAITTSDSIKEIRLENNGTDLYLAILKSNNSINVYKSTNGTSAWASFGSQITDASTLNLTCHPTTGFPVVTYVKANRPNFNYWENNTWKTKEISNTTTAREVNAVFSSAGILIVTFTENTYLYNSYYATYGSNYSVKKNQTKIGAEMGGINMSTDGSTIYMGYLNRSQEIGVAGPYVKVGNITDNGITFTREYSLQQGILATNIYVTARNGKAYAIIDDNGRGFSHCHAFSFDGSKWEPFGENQLPYFKGIFYDTHKYNLYGFAPNIEVSTQDGNVYISMISWEGTGGANRNNGPIIMKYVAKNWTTNTKP